MRNSYAVHLDPLAVAVDCYLRGNSLVFFLAGHASIAGGNIKAPISSCSLARCKLPYRQIDAIGVARVENASKFVPFLDRQPGDIRQ